MKLVIVESPAKAKTIEKYLGSDFKVDASGGHIRDLPVKSFGIDVDNNYEPEYVISADKKDVIKRLAEKIKKADEVFLATDPDREGEAISWHLQQALNLEPNAKNRIQFNEITKTAVNRAISQPRQINMNLVDAQQARRVLDRLVGYKLSPVLCKKIKGKLSAGRVQSAALKMIVDKEKEIIAFKPEEYWTLTAHLQKHDGADKSITFKASLQEKNGKKFKPSSEEEIREVLDAVIKHNVADILKTDWSKQAVSAKVPFTVADVKKGTSLSYPSAPFTTSTMQQDASNKLGLPAKTTMMVAQQLYEGVEIRGMGQVALVTYIRTDSVRVSDDAARNARGFIAENYGSQYVPAKANIYKSKKNVQDAHEAIRPTNLEITPESVKDKLQKNHYRLYQLIYTRFLASQSVPAQYDTVNATVAAANYGFKVSGKTLKFDGYMRIYSSIQQNKDDDETSAKLPELTEGQTLDLLGIKPEQKFTKPPARFTESSLIKNMEENGIGRPSTYSAILTTLYNRTYVVKEDKALVPTDLGILVTEYLQKYFENIVNIEFTANMEDRLDDIEEKGANWREIIDKFFKPLQKDILTALNSDERMEIKENVSDVHCEKCGALMLFKTGRFGQYLACPNYPDCKNTKSLKAEEAVITDVKCDKCGALMVEKKGRFGKYLSCPNYPDCKNTKSLAEIVAECPDCGGGVSKRVSKRGTAFYGCNNYPNCKFMSWDVPAKEKCPKCGKYMIEKPEGGVTLQKCSDKACGYSREVKADDNN